MTRYPSIGQILRAAIRAVHRLLYATAFIPRIRPVQRELGKLRRAGDRAVGNTPELTDEAELLAKTWKPHLIDGVQITAPGHDITPISPAIFRNCI